MTKTRKTPRIRRAPHRKGRGRQAVKKKKKTTCPFGAWSSWGALACGQTVCVCPSTFANKSSSCTPPQDKATNNPRATQRTGNRPKNNHMPHPRQPNAHTQHTETTLRQVGGPRTGGRPQPTRTTKGPKRKRRKRTTTRTTKRTPEMGAASVARTRRKKRRPEDERAVRSARYA